MRRLIGLLVFTLFAAPAAAQQAKSAPSKAGGDEEEVERKITGGGKIAAGWTAKVDRNGPIAKVKLEVGPNNTVHVETAASAVFYRPGVPLLTRNYHLGATFTQNEFTPGHAEPYGLIFGGEVRGDTLDYTYFMVQSDGKFSIRRRTGAKSEDLASGWMESEAVAQADAKGIAVNKLLVERTPTVVRFMVNGTEVFKTTPAAAHPDGITGVRVSHNLSVDVSAAMRMQM